MLSLIDAGHDVHIIDNLSTGTELLIPKDTPFTKCDIDDQKTITSLIQNNVRFTNAFCRLYSR